MRRCSLARMVLLVGMVWGAAANMGCAATDTVSISGAKENQQDHGLAAPVVSSTIQAAFVDEEGRRIVFTRLRSQHDPSYLFIDAETGQTQQVYADLRAPTYSGTFPSPDNLVYDYIDGHLLGIDLMTRQVHRLGQFGGRGSLALGMHRLDDGTVYLGIYPTGELYSYDPGTNTFTDHGAVNEESWRQYLRPLTSDDAGWIYGGIAMERMQIIGFNPKTQEVRHFVPEENRFRGYTPNLFRGKDGKVYARADRYQFGAVLEVHENGWGWHALYEGRATPVDEPAPRAPTAGNTALGVGNEFPDGSRIARLNTADRELLVLDAGADEPRLVTFDYESQGVNIYSMIAGPDGKVYGSTGNPLRVWSYDPATGELWNRGMSGGGHINQYVRLGDKLYATVYSRGALYEYDPAQPFENGVNPRQVHYDVEAFDLYGRPRAMLAHDDGRHILIGGMAARVLYGSGLLIYDTETGAAEILDRTQLVEDQGITAMVTLPDGDVLVGTTTHPPTAAPIIDVTASQIYRLDMETRTVTNRWTLEPESPQVQDLVLADDGLVYGLAAPNRLFVFDPKRNEIISNEPLEGYGEVTGYQAPRSMVIGPDGMIYALFTQAVVRIDPATRRHEAIARPDQRITSGIAIVGDRVYYGCGASLFSSSITPAQEQAAQ